MAASTNLLEGPALILHLPPVLELSADQFFYFCQSNRDLRIERTAEGDLVIMTPAGGRSSARNAAVTTQLTTWAIQDGRGVAFDSSAGFNLPNGATRSPDAAWVLRSRLTL